MEFTVGRAKATPLILQKNENCATIAFILYTSIMYFEENVVFFFSGQQSACEKSVKIYMTPPPRYTFIYFSHKGGRQ